MSYNPTNNKKEFLILPRGYLSWSAIQTFQRSKEQYIRHYFYGEPQEFWSPSIDFGSEFAKCIESRKKHPDPVMDTVISAIPAMPSREYGLDAYIPSKYGRIKIVGKLDQFDPETLDFDEFKTGMRKWTQNTAHEHGQMKLYALMIFLRYKKLDSKKTLVWIETERNGDGEICLTGNIKRFEVSYSALELFEFANQVIKVACEIHELYKEEINKTI